MTSRPAALLYFGIAATSSAALLPPVFDPQGGFVRSPCLVLATNFNATGVIFYTVDGGDPRDHFGNVATNARCYLYPRLHPSDERSTEARSDADAISVNRSMIIRARVKSGTNWSELTAAPFTADQDFSKLLFTEVMFHPTQRDRGPDEFVEFKNVGTVPLDLSGLILAEIDTKYLHGTFPPGSIVGPGQFFVLARDTNEFRTLYPGAPVEGQYDTQLGNSSATPAVMDTNGAVAASMHYDSHAPWQVLPDDHAYFANPTNVSAADFIGFSLVRATLDPAADSHHYRTWRASYRRKGSPHADDPEPNIPAIYVNELLSRSGSDFVDTVELFNPNPTNVNIGGWWLSDHRNYPFRYHIPSNTIIAALGYMVFDESQFNAGADPFSFDAAGERCYLFSGEPDGTVTGYSHGFVYHGSDQNVTFGRVVDSTGLDHFARQVSRTFGQSNSGPLISPVAISEIMYHPETTNSGAFIELRNRTAAPVALWDPEQPGMTWGLGVNMEFVDVLSEPTTFVPPNTTIPPQGHILFVQEDPETFRTNYNVPPGVPIFRFNTFRLRDDTENILLFKPSGSTWVVMDEVRYEDKFPWPPGADGGGQSLERISPNAFGDDPANWRANPSGISPGRTNNLNLPPRVWAGGAQTNFVNRPATLSGIVWDDYFPGTVLTLRWMQVSGPATAVFNNSTSAVTTATFPVAGRYNLRLVVSDGQFVQIDNATVDVVNRPFDTWRGTNFTSVELNDPSVSGEDADPDNDGIRNVEEYLFDLPPKTGNARRPVRAEVIDGHLRVTWTQLLEVPDAVISAERADLLTGPWFGGPGLFEQTAQPLAAGRLAELSLRELLPGSDASQRFIRLQISVR